MREAHHTGGELDYIPERWNIVVDVDVSVDVEIEK